jgi:hypothetical protein
LWNLNRRFALAANWFDRLARFLPNSASLNGFESGGDTCPARFFAPSEPANRRINVAGKKKGRTMNPLIQSKNTTILPVLIALVLGCFALSPQSQAVCQEGCDAVNFNTFLGEDALLDHSGVSNTAVGWHALKNNPSASWNTAIGTEALENNLSGYDNTATGVAALGNNTGGADNTAIGSNAMFANTTGSDNTATGFAALGLNTTGIFNVADGMWALYGNETGFQNTATGYLALWNSNADRNTATGYSALSNNTSGNKNTADGANALLNNTTGNKNIALGFRAGSDLTTGDHNIDIGNPGQPGESSTIRIGRVQDQTATFIAGIAGATVPTGVAVIVNANGRLGTTTSSARYKEAIKPMDKASEAILALKPVTFRYKHALDPDGVPQFGLVAEDVEKVSPDLVVRGADGKVYTVRYDAVNAMLLNEFLKEHRKVEKLETAVAQQHKDFQAAITHERQTMEAAVAQLKEQVQKVSAQLEASKPAPQVVNNNQ